MNQHLTNTPRAGEPPEQTAARSARTASLEEGLQHLTENLDRLNQEQGHPKGENIVDGIVRERGRIYGSFADIASMTQELKSAIRGRPGWHHLPDDAREALDMNMLKVARIICGNPDHVDNWDDIGGYSKMIADRIRADGR